MTLVIREVSLYYCYLLLKGLSWCPWQSSLIATGGGTADKTLHLWNIVSGAIYRSVETMSQVNNNTTNTLQ